MMKINLEQYVVANATVTTESCGFAFSIDSSGFTMKNNNKHDVLVAPRVGGSRYPAMQLHAEESLTVNNACCVACIIDENSVLVTTVPTLTRVKHNVAMCECLSVEWDVKNLVEYSYTTWYNTDEGVVYYNRSLSGEMGIGVDTESLPLTTNDRLYKLLTEYDNVHHCIFSGKWFTMVPRVDSDDEFTFKEVFLK